MQPLVDGIWTEARALRFWYVETGTRMTVVRLAGGGLFVHSPIPLADGLRRFVDGLGPVRAVVAPSLFHHLSLREWMDAYPEAAICACPGLEKRRPDLPWNRIRTLGDTPELEWRGEIDQVFFGARPLENEVVFFHRATNTFVCADAVFNLWHHPSAFTRVVAFLMGHLAPGATLLERVLIRDRRAAREQVDRMLAWHIDRIVLAHGPMIERDGAAVLRRAYAWL